VRAFGWQIEMKQLDGDERVQCGSVVRPKYRPESTSADLMKNPKGPEGVRRDGAGSVRGQ
jgi:hypothetical protein